MPALLAPVLALAIVLVVSGFDKLWRPDGAATALRSAGLTASTAPGAIPRSRRLARALGTVEVAIGVATIVVPAATERVTPSVITLLALAGTFAGFAWFVIRLRSVDASAACGCFGSGAPPGPVNIRLNLIASGLALTMTAAVLVSGRAPSVTVITDAGTATTLAVLALLAAAVPLFLLAPGLLADLDPKRLTTHDATVPVFAVNGPLGDRR